MFKDLKENMNIMKSRKKNLKNQRKLLERKNILNVKSTGQVYILSNIWNIFLAY